MEQRFNITGMSCAACQARVFKAVSSLDGVRECSVNLLTNSMVVKGNESAESIIKAVSDAGYGASEISEDEEDFLAENLKKLNDSETKKLLKRLIFSAVFTLILMYISMGHMMLGLPLPDFMEDDTFISGTIQGILSLIVLLINRKFFVNGFKGLMHKAANMDTLVALGSGVSFIYSVVILVSAWIRCDKMPDLYFESAAMILTLITVGKLLESVSKGRTTSAIRGLMELAPKMAVTIKLPCADCSSEAAGKEMFEDRDREAAGKKTSDGIDCGLIPEEILKSERIHIPAKDLKVGDIFVVEPGMSIPADGEVLYGESMMDESALTGESELVKRGQGSFVMTAAINAASSDGTIICKALKVGKDTTLSQIIKMVDEANMSKAPIARIADKAAAVFVPVVMAAALLTWAVWMIVGGSAPVVALSGQNLFTYAIMRAISVLVISCPCALGLATPVAIMVGSGVGSKAGILFKTAAALEETGKGQIVVLDKTGTITTGEAGSDKIKEDSREGVDELYELGLNVVMLSGDKKERASLIAEQVGIKYVCAGVLPDGKGKVINALKQPWTIDAAGDGLLKTFPQKAMERASAFNVLMVGDGINDAPALKAADTGLAIGAGKDIAVDAADVVIMNNSVRDVAAAVRLSRRTVLIIKENLFWAFIYNIICIPLAAGVYTGLFGWSMNPMIGAAAMALSSFCVVMNALRLNLFDPYKNGSSKKMKDVSEKQGDQQCTDECGSRKKSRCKLQDISEIVEKICEENNKKEFAMEKVIKIEGMMCPHCSGRVKDALMQLDGVADAAVSHETGEAILSVETALSNEILAKAVTDAGYKVIEIK